MEPIEFAEGDKGRQPRKDLWPFIRRWLCITAAVLALAGATLAAITGFHYGPIVYDYLCPYARLYAPKPVSDMAVTPLFDLDTQFDVAVTIWQGEEFFQPNVSEPVLFSKVLFRDFSLRSHALKTTISFEIPPFNMSRLFLPDIRAAVTFNPRTPSPVDHVSKYTFAARNHRIFPAANSEELLATGEWGEPLSVRRRLLDSLTVHVPLAVVPPRYHSSAQRRVVNSTHVYIINETHPFQRDEWLSGFNKLWHDRHFCRAGILTCAESERERDVGSYYATMGHFLGKSELGDDGEGHSTRLAYNPFMGYLPPSLGNTVHRPVIPLKQHPDLWMWKDDDMDDSEDDSDVKPLQLNLTLQLSVLDAARQRALLFVAEKTAGDNSYDYRGEREKKAGHDMWAFSNGLIGNPIAGAHVWRRIVLVVIHKLLGVAVTLLTVVYWYTRKTSAGLSLSSIWTRVLVVVPSSIHYVATSEVRFIREVTLMWWIVIASKCVGEYYQLRLVFPIDPRTSGLSVRSRGGSVSQRVVDKGNGVDIDLKLSVEATIERRKWTHRERDTMRLEPSWKVAVGTFLACFVFCYACRGWIIAPALPRGHDRSTQDFLAMLAKAIGWAGFTCANLLQIRMNYYAGTFAGTYALVAYLQIGVEVCEILYNFSLVMGDFYVIHGLSVFEASRVVFSLAVLVQAVALPRVEQVGLDEE